MEAQTAQTELGDDQSMFDQVKTRHTLVIETSVDRPEQAVADYLGVVWQIKDRGRDGTRLRLHAATPLRDGLIATAKMQVWLNRLGGGLSVRADVVTQCHGITRQRYGIPDDVKGMAGATNFALPSSEYDPTDLEDQIDGLVALPIALLDHVVAALPGAVVRQARSKIVNAEVCLDVPCADPQVALRKDRLAPQAGTTAVTHTAFATATESGRKLCNKERTRTHGPELIAYEKWDAHVRFEKRGHGLKAVAEVLGGETPNDAPLTVEGLSELLVAFYNAAGEGCCERKDHFVRASQSQRTIVDLIVALMPLIRIMLREAPTAGYRPRAKAAAAARRLVMDLLSSGITHAVGLPMGTQVRQVLEELAAPGGPLTRGHQPTMFCLSADYA